MQRSGNAGRPTGHLSEGTSERQQKGLLFGALFASAAPPCSRELRALFRFFFQRRVLRPAGFRRTPPWCRSVIDHGVQRRRFGAKPGPERTEAQTPMKEDDGGTNVHRRERCPRNGPRICIRPEQIHGVVRHPENSIGSPYGSLCVIERKRRPTWKITQQPNQSPNRPVQKATLRTPKGRAVCAPEDALVCASVDAPFACREARRSARRKTRGSARRETRRSARRETRVLRAGRRAALRAVRRAVLRAGKRAAFARKTRRVRVACARGRRAACTLHARRPVRVFAAGGRRLAVVVVRPGPRGG